MLSVAESADILGVSNARVRALIADGVLPAVKIGRAWALREEDVMQRLSAHPGSGRPRMHAETAENGGGDEGTAPRDLGCLYRECKEAFRFRPTADEVKSASCREEAAFYMAVADFFLKSRQAELVEAGAY